MKFYTAKVLLKGSHINQVRKGPLSPAEIILLQAIHGNDAVTEIQPSKPMRPQRNERTPDIVELVPANSRYKWSAKDDAAERERLRFLYPAAIARLGARNNPAIGAIFGPSFNPLPKELAGMDAEPDEAEESAEAELMD